MTHQTLTPHSRQSLSRQPLLRALIYAVCAVLLIALAACSPAPSTLTAAPNVVFKTINNQQFDTASLKGQVTLINFWATSCSTCVQSMPMLSGLHTTYSPSGYRMVAVAMDYDNLAFINNFAQSRKLGFDVVHDADGAIAKAFENTKLTPTSYLIDKKGNVVKRYVGKPSEEAFKATIDALLKA